METVAPIACKPFTCWSTGRRPMAQPPGSDTRARPQRARSGPRTSTEARMVFTRSYGAVGSPMARACSTRRPALGGAASTPIWRRSRAIVRTSMSCGTLARRSGSAVRSAAHMIGNAAFFAPETRTSPSSGRPPRSRSLSTGAPLLGRECAHRKRMDLLAHALAKRRIHELVALHAVAAGELGRDDQRLEVLAVAEHFHMLAGEARLDALLHSFGRDHQY